MNRQETAQILDQLRGCYGGTPDAAMLDAWAEAFQHHPAGAAQKATQDWITSEERWPKLNQLLEETKRCALRGESAEHECDGGWEWIDENTVAPCRICTPDTRLRWEGEHYAMNHHCGDCDGLRKGRGSDAYPSRPKVMPRPEKVASPVEARRYAAKARVALAKLADAMKRRKL